MFPSTWDGVQSCRHPVQGEAGVIGEEAVAGGLDPAVAWGSWWFGISALIHRYSPFQEMESGYILFRGHASNNNKRKVNTEMAGQAESFMESC